MAVTVVAAAVERDGRVLVLRRAPGQKLAGMWEFPGGKVEPGEREDRALERELWEELGISGETQDFVAECDHAYDFYAITLKLYRFQWTGGEIALSVHDRMEWVTAEGLEAVDFAPADVPLAARLREVLRAEAHKAP